MGIPNREIPRPQGAAGWHFLASNPWMFMLCSMSEVAWEMLDDPSVWDEAEVDETEREWKMAVGATEIDAIRPCHRPIELVQDAERGAHLSYLVAISA